MLFDFEFNPDRKVSSIEKKINTEILKHQWFSQSEGKLQT